MATAAKNKLPFPSHVWDDADDRPRVLFECSDPALGWAASGLLDRSGYAVAICWGPSTYPASKCPLLTGDGCVLAEGADVVLHAFPASEYRRHPILAGLRENVPDVPVYVELPVPSREKYKEEIEGCGVIEFPMTPASLVAAVDDAVGHTKRAKPTNGSHAEAPKRRKRTHR